MNQMKEFNIISIFVALSLIFFISCNKKEIDSKQDVINEKLVKVDPNIILKDSIYTLIKKYIHKYPQFDAFVLMKSPKSLINSCPKGFLLGPAYEGLYNDNFPIMYLLIDEKYIFVDSPMDKIGKSIDSQNSFYSIKMIPRGVDSLFLFPDWIIKNGGELYIKRAIYFSEDEKGRLIINNCPDTLFMPQLKGTIEFKNVK